MTQTNHEQILKYLYIQKTRSSPTYTSWDHLVQLVCDAYNIESRPYLPADISKVEKLIHDIRNRPPLSHSTAPIKPISHSSVSHASLLIVMLLAMILTSVIFIPSVRNMVISFASHLLTDQSEESVQITVTDSQAAPVLTDLNVAPPPIQIGGDPNNPTDTQAGGGTGIEYALTPIVPTAVWESTAWPTTIPTPLPTTIPPLIEAVAQAPPSTPFPTPDPSQHAPYGYVDECWVKFGPINQCLDNRVLTELNVPTPVPEPQLTCEGAEVNQVVGQADSPMQEFFGLVEPNQLVYKDNPMTPGLDPDSTTALPVGVSCSLNRSAIEYCMVGTDGRAYVLLMEVINIYPPDPAYRWMARIDLQPDLSDPASCQ